MSNLKYYVKHGAKIQHKVDVIVANAKRKLAKHLKKQPNDTKAKDYLNSI